MIASSIQVIVVDLLVWLSKMFIKFLGRYSRIYHWLLPVRPNTIVDKLIYPFLDKLLDSSISKPPKSVISAAYWLTDLYDKSRKEEYAYDLSKKILGLLPDTNRSQEEIRMVLGCWYSIFKKARNDKAEWLKDIDDAYDAYCLIKSEKQIENCSGINEHAKEQLRALYASNFGGILHNKFKVTNDKSYLMKAEEKHKQALKYRENLHSKYGDNANPIYVSKENLAVIYYYQTNYAAAVKQHNEALSFYEAHPYRNRQAIHHVMKQIIGCYAKWLQKTGIEPPKNDELILCKEYYSKCTKFYRSNKKIILELDSSMQIVNNVLQKTAGSKKAK